MAFSASQGSWLRLQAARTRSGLLRRALRLRRRHPSGVGARPAPRTSPNRTTPRLRWPSVRTRFHTICLLRADYCCADHWLGVLPFMGNICLVKADPPPAHQPGHTTMHVHSNSGQRLRKLSGDGVLWLPDVQGPPATEGAA